MDFGTVIIRRELIDGIMEVNQELTEQYSGKKYRRPSDNRVLTVSHILESKIPNGGTYFEAFFNVENPEPGMTGAGTCALESLQALKEIE
jgi:hypothetical protein